MKIKVTIIGSSALLECPKFKIEALGENSLVSYSEPKPSEEVIAKAEQLKDCLLKIIEISGN